MEKVTPGQGKNWSAFSLRARRKMSLQVTKGLNVLRLHICLISFRPNQKKDLNGQTLCHVLWRNWNSWI